VTDDPTQTLRLTVHRVRLKLWRVFLVVTPLAVPFNIERFIIGPMMTLELVLRERLPTAWVLPRFYGHLVKAHNEPGGVSWHNGGGFQRSTSVKRWRCSMRLVSASARSPQTWGLGPRSWGAAARVASGTGPGVSRPRSTPRGGGGAPPSRVSPRHEGAGVFARSGSVLRESVAMTYRMIQRCRHAFPIRMMCRCVRVSPSGYYGWVTRVPSA